MNTLVDAYREQVPHDQRSDDELTLLLGQQHDQDGSFASVPDFLEDYQRLKTRTEALAEMNKPTFGDRAGRAVGQAVGSTIRAVADIPAGMAESLGIATARLDAGRGYANGASDMDAPVTLEAADQPKPEETLPYKVGGLIRKGAEAISPAPVPELAESFWATKLPSTLGSILGFIAGAGLEKAIVKGSLDAVVKAMADDALKEAIARGLPKAAQEAMSTAVLGAGTTAAGAYKEAIAKGSSPEQATQAFLLNLPVGASMALPVGEILGPGKTLLGKTARASATGGAVIGAQQVAGNIIAGQTFDPGREPLANIVEGAGAGAIVTGALGALFHKLSGSTPAKPTPIDPAAAQHWRDVPHDEQVQIAALMARKAAGAATLQDSAVMKSFDAQQAAFATAYTQMSKEQRAAYVTPETQAETPVVEEAKVEETTVVPATASEPAPVAISPEKAAARAAAVSAVIDRKLNPVQEAMREKVAKAAAETDTAPTEAQKEAGNYAKGKVSVDGMEISIENPKGSERTGVGTDGKPWSVTMPDHYGYFLGTEGMDKDHVDVTIGPNPAGDKAFVIDQIDPKTGDYDEHKTFIGFDTKEHAIASYDGSFSDGSGPARRGAVTEMTREQLKTWLKSDGVEKPLAYVKPETKPETATDKILAKPLGSTSHTEITGMSDADINALDKARRDGDKAFVTQRDAAAWGSKQDQAIVPELTKLRDEAQAKVMASFDNPEAFTAAQLKVYWLNAAIEGANRSGPNYEAAVKEGHIKPKEAEAKFPKTSSEYQQAFNAEIEKHRKALTPNGRKLDTKAMEAYLRSFGLPEQGPESVTYFQKKLYAGSVGSEAWTLGTIELALKTMPPKSRAVLLDEKAQRIAFLKRSIADEFTLKNPSTQMLEGFEKELEQLQSEVKYADQKQSPMAETGDGKARPAAQVAGGKPGEVQKPAGAGSTGETQKQAPKPSSEPKPQKLNKPKLSETMRAKLTAKKDELADIRKQLDELEKQKPSKPFEIQRDKKQGGFILNPIDGIDPAKLPLYTRAAKVMFEAGFYKFAEFAAGMVEAIGDTVIPHLAALYESSREFFKSAQPEAAKEMTKLSDMGDALSKFHDQLTKREVRRIESAERIGPEQVDVEGQGVQMESGRGGGGNVKAKEAWEDRHAADETLAPWEDLSDEQKANFIASTPEAQQATHTLRPAWFIPSAKDKASVESLSAALLSGARRSTESQGAAKSWVHTLAAILDKVTGQVHLVSVFENNGVKVSKFTKELGRANVRDKSLLLQSVFDARMESGEKRYDFIGSARTGDLHEYYHEVYPTRAAFRERFQNDLTNRTQAVEKGHGAAEVAMEQAGVRRTATAADEEAQKAADLELAAGTREATPAGLPTTEEGAVDIVQQQVDAPKTEEKPLNLVPAEVEALKRLPLDKDGKLQVDDLADAIREGPDVIDDELLDVIQKIADPEGANQKEFFTRVQDVGLERALKEYGYKIDTGTGQQVERSHPAPAEGNLPTDERGAPSGAGGSETVVGGGEDRAGQPRPEGSQGNAEPPASGGDVRFSERQNVPHGTKTSEELASQWHANLESAANNGIGVTVLKGLHEGGEFDAQKRAAVLTVADHLNPTADNIVLQIHELGAHPAFANLTPEQQAMLYRAGNRLGTPEGFRPRVSEAIKEPVRQCEITSEENLVEAVSRNMAAEGFNPADARGLGEQIVRLLKEVYYRTSLAFQRAVLGDDHVNPDLARRWFENRVKSFMAGDASPMSFLSFMGGGKPDTEKLAGEYTHEGQPAVFNYETASMDYAEALPDSLRAMRYNQNGLRYSERGTAFQRTTDPNLISPDLNSEPRVAEDVAAFNAHGDMLRGLFDAFEKSTGNPSKLTFKQWVDSGNFVKMDSLPSDRIAQRNKELLATDPKAKPVNDNLSIDGITSDPSKQVAADKAWRLGWQTRNQMSERRAEAEQTLSKAPDQLDKANERLENLQKRYLEADFIQNTAGQELDTIIKGFRNDVKSAGQNMRKAGVLSQIIKQLDERMDNPLALDAKYAAPIEKLFAEFSGGNSEKFFDLLQSVSELGIDWKRATPREIADDMAWVLTPDDPQLTSTKSKALASVLTAFAKRNSEIMDLLSARKSKAVEERAAFEDVLKTALAKNKEGIKNARALAKKLPKLGAAAGRLIDRFEELQGQRNDLLDDLQRAKSFNEFHDAAVPEFNKQMAVLEQRLGAQSEHWEASDGAEYSVAPSAKATPEQVSANKQVFRFKAGQSNLGDVVSHIQANNEWLANVPEAEQGMVWNDVQARTRKLEQVATDFSMREIKSSMNNTYFGSLVHKLQAIGLPVTRAIASRLRRAEAEKEVGRSDAEVYGTEWEVAQARAKKAMGLKKIDNEQFQRIYHDGALDFAKARQDLRDAFKGDREAFDALLPELKRFFDRNPETRDAVNKPGAWAALSKYYDSTFKNSQWVVERRGKLGVKVEEALPDGSKLLRDPIGGAFFKAFVRLRRPTIQMWRDMREAGWDGSKNYGKLEAKRVAKEYAADPDQLRKEVGFMVTQDIQREFVQPLVDREGAAMLYNPTRADGLQTLASRASLRAAHEQSGGDLVKMAEGLYDARAETDSPQTKAEFVGQTLASFQAFYDSLHSVNAQHDHAMQMGLPVPPRLLQDARTSEQYPSQWLEYATYGRHEMHQMSDLLAGQAAYGSNMQGVRGDFQNGIRELGAKADLLRTESERVQRENPNLKGTGLQAKIRAAVENLGEKYGALVEANGNLKMLKRLNDQFNAIVIANTGLPMEAKAVYELVGATAGSAVQGLGTAIMDIGTVLAIPAKFGVGSIAAKNVVRTVEAVAKNVFGSLAQFLHIQTAFNADNARIVRAGLTPPGARRKFVDFMVSQLSTLPHTDVNATIGQRAGMAATRGALVTARTLKAILGSGFGKAKEGAANVYAPLQPHAMFSQMANWMHFGLIDSWSHSFEGLVERAIEHFADPKNAGAFADPAFKFSAPEQLGYKPKLFGLINDNRAFEYINQGLADYGMTIEGLARDTMQRRQTDKSASVFTDDNFRRFAAIVNKDAFLHSDLTTRAPWLMNSPMGRFMNPLLGWSIARGHETLQEFRKATGERSLAAFAGSLKTYLAIVPAALAIAWFRDEYDRKLLKKKANRQPADSLAGMVDSLSRVGWFGAYGDALNSMYNRDTEKPFSVDNRVFFMSSLLNAKRAVQNWVEQDFHGDYATVVRPLIASLGGNGYLQYAEILNNAMSLDNSESRITARINTVNYLRVAGRELGLDVRVAAGGGDVISTPIRPWIGQMTMAAMANDAAGFEAARREAIRVATQMGAEDPVGKVKLAFASANPLKTVFKTSVTDQEYRKILGVLPPDGAAAVSESVRLMNAYGERIGARPFVGKTEKVAAANPFAARLALPTFGQDRARSNLRSLAADKVFAQ